MIAVDSSSLVDYITGGTGPDLEALEMALSAGTVCLPPVVLTEVLSKATRAGDAAVFLRSLPLLPLTDGYWERAGQLRASLIGAGKKAPLPDTLIAQSCIDHDVPLITRDVDFKNYVRFGLKLV